MSDKWIIDVLSDLKRFSHRNGLFDLADAIDDSLAVARRELSRCGGEAPDPADSAQGQRAPREGGGS